MFRQNLWRLVGVVVCIAVLGFFLNVSTESFASIFGDVSQNHENSEAINYVQQRGIVEGYGDGTYRPDVVINRAEFTKIIIEAIYPGEAEGSQCFPDVLDEWYAKYVCFAKTKNIVFGYPDGMFRPENNISLVEAAKIVARAWGYDSADDEVWFKPYVDILAEQSALPLTLRSFEHIMTRGEMAEIIYRMHAKISDKASLDFDTLSQLSEIEVSEIDDSEKENRRQLIIQSIEQSDTPATIVLDADEIVSAEGSTEDIVEGDAVPADELDDTTNDQAQKNVIGGGSSGGGAVTSGNANTNTNVVSPTTSLIFKDKTCVSNPNVKLSNAFFPTENILVIRQTGSVMGGEFTNDSMIRTIPSASDLPVYAPTDMDLMAVQYYSYPTSGNREYTLRFQASCEIALKFRWIDPADSIKAVLGAIPTGSSSSVELVINSAQPLHFAAGDIIGYVRAPSPSTIDFFHFGLSNSAQHNDFLKGRDTSGWYFDDYYSECPYEYVSDSTLRNNYYAKFATFYPVDTTGNGGTLVAGATCRDTDQYHINGTISGKWFDNSTVLSEADIANLEAGGGGESMGIANSLVLGMNLSNKYVIVGRTGEYTYTQQPAIIGNTNSTFANPSTITGEHCYEDDNSARVIYLKLKSATVMDVFISETAGTCPASFPSQGVVTYYR